MVEFEGGALPLAISDGGCAIAKAQVDRGERIAASEPPGQWINTRGVAGAEAHAPFASGRAPALIDGARQRLGADPRVGRQGR